MWNTNALGVFYLYQSTLKEICYEPSCQLVAGNISGSGEW